MATFTSTQTGDWTDPTTWGETVEYPGLSQDDDRVTITTGHTVTYDMDNSSGYYIGYIACSNILEFSTSMDTYLKIDAVNAGTHGIELFGGGDILRIGTEGSPLSSSYTATIEYSDNVVNSHDIVYNNNNGLVDMHGAEKTYKGITTNAIAASGTSFTMTAVPTDWSADDELVILPTGNTYSETDYVSITSISGTTVNIDATTYSHLSGVTVLNVTRNIVLKGGTNQPSTGIDGNNSSFNLSNVRIENIRATGSSNVCAFDCLNQSNIDRPVIIDNCVAIDCLSCGFGGGGSGTVKQTNCIAVNCYHGQSGANEVALTHIKGCYFIDNTWDGCYINNRGSFIIEDSVACGNGDDGFVLQSGSSLMINCQSYANLDYGIESSQATLEMYNCLIGESDIGTQMNGDADLLVYRCPMVRANDCKFSSTDEWDCSDAFGQGFSSVNHNQVAGAFKQITFQGGSEFGTVSTDTSIYRTTSPSIKFDGIRERFPLYYKIPIKVENGDSVSIEIYGKKSGTGWSEEPYARLIGNGIDDTDTWTTDDTNWNALTLTGTAARDGVIYLIVFANESTLTFNIDDITVTVT